jgi:small GTP-binding protein
MGAAQSRAARVSWGDLGVAAAVAPPSLAPLSVCVCCEEQMRPIANMCSVCGFRPGLPSSGEGSSDAEGGMGIADQPETSDEHRPTTGVASFVVAPEDPVYRSHNLMQLPEDVWRWLFGTLPLSTLYLVTGVCRSWRRLAFGDQVWRRVAAERFCLDLTVKETTVREWLLTELGKQYLPRSFRGALSSVQSSSDTHCVVMSHPGGGACGKSALVIRFVQNYFVSEYDATIDDSYRRLFQVDGKAIVFDILDTAGQEEYAAMRPAFLAGPAQFFIICSDFSNALVDYVAQLNSLRSEIEQARHGRPWAAIVVQTKLDWAKPASRTLFAVVHWCIANECAFFSTR